MASQTELIAREAKAQADGLRVELTLLMSTVKELDLPELRERTVVIEARLAQIEKTLDELRQVPVLEDRVNKLERHKEETDKRRWQFVFIAVGAGCAVVGGVVVQLVSALLKK